MFSSTPLGIKYLNVDRFLRTRKEPILVAPGI